MLTAFVSYKYGNEETEALASDIGILLQTLDVKVSDGKPLNALEGLNAQIKERIERAHFLISLVLKDHGSQYVSQELGYALGHRIPVVVVTDDESATRGLMDDQYMILLKRGGLSLAADLVRTVNAIKTKRAVSLEPTYSQHSAKSEIDTEGWIPVVRTKLSQLRELISAQDFATALDFAGQVLHDYTDCWRAYIAKSACLVHLHRYDEARKVLDQVIELFSSHKRALSYAYQNKGWLSQRRATKFDHAEANQRVEAYRQSIDFEPRLVVFLNLIHNLLTLDRISEAESELANCLREFEDARSEFIRQVQLQGADFVQQIAKSKLLSAVLFPRRPKGGDPNEG